MEIKEIHPEIYKDQSDLNSLKLLRYIHSGILKSTAEIAVCSSLLSMRNSKTGLCNPYIETIAFSSGCSRRTVERALNRLEKSGILVIQRTKYYAGKDRNLYFFTFDFDFLYEMSLQKSDDWEHPFKAGDIWASELREIYRLKMLRN